MLSSIGKTLLCVFDSAQVKVFYLQYYSKRRFVHSQKNEAFETPNKPHNSWILFFVDIVVFPQCFVKSLS